MSNVLNETNETKSKPGIASGQSILIDTQYPDIQKQRPTQNKEAPISNPQQKTKVIWNIFGFDMTGKFSINNGFTGFAEEPITGSNLGREELPETNLKELGSYQVIARRSKCQMVKSNLATKIVIEKIIPFTIYRPREESGGHQFQLNE